MKLYENNQRELDLAQSDAEEIYTILREVVFELQGKLEIPRPDWYHQLEGLEHNAGQLKGALLSKSVSNALRDLFELKNSISRVLNFARDALKDNPEEFNTLVRLLEKIINLEQSLGRL
ncbi:MAG: hypothetical protein Q8Q35_04425 [Nanoarchaeota archaeon]|nr:hypothetical protein [Nanoarchaeota archaeon]